MNSILEKYNAQILLELLHVKVDHLLRNHNGYLTMD